MSASATITVQETSLVRPVFSRAELKNYLKDRTRVNERAEVTGYCYMNDDLQLILKPENSQSRQDMRLETSIYPTGQTDGLAQFGKGIFRIWAEY